MKLKLTFIALAIIVFTAAAHAQGGNIVSGCSNSPENPTALLALFGAAGAAFTALRQRRRK